MKEKMNVLVTYIKFLCKWLVVATVVGILGGLAGSAFHLCIDHVTALRMEINWILYLLPLGGLFIVLLYKLSHGEHGLDTNGVLAAVRMEKKVPLRMTPLIFIGGVVSHLFGASVGREGAALQLGGSIGYNTGKLFRLNAKDLHLVVMAGMSSVFAALFGTPITAMFFSIEVTCVGVMYYAALIPCLISSYIGYQVALLFHIPSVRFSGVPFPTGSVDVVLKVALLAALCALVAILFCKAIQMGEHWFSKWFKNPYIRIFVGGTLVVLLSALLGTRDYNGVGMDVITLAICGEASALAFLCKMIFTAISVGTGFKGGEIVPAFFVGTTFGAVVGPLLGLAPELSAAVGFVSLFCGVVNCPVASLLLGLEVFGGEGIIIFTTACVVSYILSGYGSLYKSQKIMYSKTEATFINAETK